MNSPSNGLFSRIFLCLICFLLFYNTIQAQLEVKGNPFGAAIHSPNIGVEMILHDNFGLEASIRQPQGPLIIRNEAAARTDVLYRSGQHVRLDAKYYFIPKAGGDLFYGSAFVNGTTTNYTGESEFFTENPNYKNTALQLGLASGIKWVGWDRLVVEYNFGAAISVYDKTDYEDPTRIAEEQGLRWNPLLNFNIGYRFNKRKKRELKEG